MSHDLPAPLPARSLVPLAAALVVLSASTRAQRIERISVDSSGNEGSAMSVASVLSADGSTYAFSSYADNLVPGDTNGFRDVFVCDAWTGAPVRVSRSSAGLEADSTSYSPSLSGNGRFIVFTSNATNLVRGDTNGVSDVFVHDRDPDGNGLFDEGNGRTERVSVDSYGREGHGPSTVAYSHTISADGRLVVFTSAASDLVVGDGNGAADIFVHDRSSGLTRRVSHDSYRAEANQGSALATISGDGTVVAFQSEASNLVVDDTNSVTDVFTHELLGGLTTRVSVDSFGQQFGQACSMPALSADGGVVAFRMRSPSPVALYGIVVRDTVAGSTEELVRGFYSSGSFWSHERWSSWNTALGFPALSADGSKVAYMTSNGSTYTYDGWPFSSFSADVTGSVLLFDRSERRTRSLAGYRSLNFSREDQALAWLPFYAPAMSDDGKKVSFESDSPQLVRGDTNGVRDAFVYHWIKAVRPR